MKQLVLIDLSSVLHPIWHMSSKEPDPDHTSTATIAKVHALASGQEHVAVCCDSRKNWRKELDATYKANRPKSEEPLIHQMKITQETLAEDGFPVWSVEGFEADDLIAAATKLGKEAGMSVLIVSSDKDLLQLVDETVRVKSVRDGEELGATGVFEKFGVRPDQVRDYLSLVGDTSDNVKGATGIGAVKASSLLAKHGTLDALYKAMFTTEPKDLGLKPSEATSLKEFEARYPIVRKLIALRDDVEIPFSEVMKEREGKGFKMETQETAAVDAELVTEVDVKTETPTTAPAATAGALTVQKPSVLEAVPVEWERQLEPRSMQEAQTLAEYMFRSRLFTAYGTPHGVLAAVLMGRELGIQAMASLRAFHIIEGKPYPSAELLRALVIKSGKAKFFRRTARSAESVTYETQRGDDPVVSFTYTMAEAVAAGRVKDGSGYKRDPSDMLIARCSSKLAREVYPDVVLGMTSFEEVEDV